MKRLLAVFLLVGMGMGAIAQDTPKNLSPHPASHYLPLKPLPAAQSARVRLAKRLLKTSLSLKHHFPIGYGGEGDIAFFGEYSVLLSHAGDMQKAQQILRSLVPKARKESQSSDYANTQVSVGDRTVTGLYPAIHLCDALIWIARCQLEAGFKPDARQTLYQARKYAVNVPGNYSTDYSPAYVRELSPLTAIAVYLHRCGDRNGFRQTMQMAQKRMERLRYHQSFQPDWRAVIAEIAYAYALVGDFTSAERTLRKVPDEGYTAAQAAVGLLTQEGIRRKDFSPLVRVVKRFQRGGVLYQAIEELKKTGAVDSLRKVQKYHSYPEWQPWSPFYDLAVAYAHQGDRKSAITYARKVLAMRGKPKDEKDGYFYSELIPREAGLVREIPYLPNAADLIRYHLSVAEKSFGRLGAYAAIAEAQAVIGDKQGAYRSYQKSLDNSDEIMGEALNHYPASIGLSLLKLGDTACPALSRYDFLELQMEMGRELMKRLDAVQVEQRAKEAEAGWVLLGAVQVLLGRPALFVAD